MTLVVLCKYIIVLLMNYWHWHWHWSQIILLLYNNNNIFLQIIIFYCKFLKIDPFQGQQNNLGGVATQIHFSTSILGVWSCCESTKQGVKGSSPRCHCSKKVSSDRIGLKWWNFNLRLLEPSLQVDSLFLI